jgi:integrase
VQVALEAYVLDARAGRIELAEDRCHHYLGHPNDEQTDAPDGKRFGDNRLTALSRQEIEEMYASMKRNGATAAWVRRCATVLSRALTYARKSGVITFNPSMDASRPHLVQEKPYSPTSDEVQKLIEEARERDEEIADAIAIVAGTGLRKGELLGLRVADVNLEASELHIAWSVSDGGKEVGVVRKPTKRSDWRDVPVTASVKFAIERQLDRCRIRADGKLGRDIHLFSLDAATVAPHRPDTFSDRLLALVENRH